MAFIMCIKILFLFIFVFYLATDSSVISEFDLLHPHKLQNTFYRKSLVEREILTLELFPEGSELSEAPTYINSFGIHVRLYVHTS